MTHATPALVPGWPRLRRILFYVGLAAILLWFLFPLLWMALTSIKPPREYYASPPFIIPAQPTLDHYVTTITQMSVFTQMKHSVIIAVASTALSLILACFAGYAIGRFKFAGRVDIALWILTLRIMPPIAMSIPYFLLLRTFGLIDTYAGLSIIYLVFNLPFAVWMLSAYFQDIPAELEESAMVDGCSRLRSFLIITLPLTIPGLVSTGLFCFISSWNEYLFAVIFTRSQAVTIPVMMSEFLYRGVEWGPLCATAVLAVLPVFVIALAIQRNLIRMMTFGAVKG